MLDPIPATNPKYRKAQAGRHFATKQPRPQMKPPTKAAGGGHWLGNEWWEAGGGGRGRESGDGRAGAVGGSAGVGGGAERRLHLAFVKLREKATLGLHA